MMAPPWDLGRGLHDRRENLHNGSVRCNLQNYIFRFSKKAFFYFILIMLIYAKNQTFCSKSVNKARKMLVQIFGTDTFCSILSFCTWKKIKIKINFLCILLFYELFMYFFVFSTFLFLLFFLAKFVADTFWSTIMLKQINFSHWE